MGETGDGTRDKGRSWTVVGDLKGEAQGVITEGLTQAMGWEVAEWGASSHLVVVNYDDVGGWLLVSAKVHHGVLLGAWHAAG